MNCIKKFHRSTQCGFTIIEVLIAALITSIIAASTFTFYIRLHNQSENQYEISEAQNFARASLYDINKELRMAGYKIPDTHDPFSISGDTLTLYKQGIQPIDTIMYYLEEFSDNEYDDMSDLPSNKKLYKLMKKENSTDAQIFADYLSGIQFTQLTGSSINISLDVQTSLPDHSREYAHSEDGQIDFRSGYTTVTLAQRVKIRNIDS